MDSNQPPTLGLQSTSPGSDSMADSLNQDRPPSHPAMVSSASGQGAPSDAESEELDREWVNKAKEIVEKTKSDPFTQSLELNKVKAGYLRARYSKDFKTGEDSA